VGAQRTLLLIDDDGDLLETWRLMLETLGHVTFAADSGPRGVELLAEHRARIDLVILDLWMPEIDGRSTFRQLRQVDPEARVVVTSGSRAASEVNDLLAAGALGFIAKPFGIEELRDLLERTIEAG